MNTRLLLAAVFVAAVAACLVTVGLLLHGDLQLVQNITGNVTPGTSFCMNCALR